MSAACACSFVTAAALGLVTPVLLGMAAPEPVLVAAVPMPTCALLSLGLAALGAFLHAMCCVPDCSTLPAACCVPGGAAGELPGAVGSGELLDGVGFGKLPATVAAARPHRTGVGAGRLAAVSLPEPSWMALAGAGSWSPAGVVGFMLAGLVAS